MGTEQAFCAGPLLWFDVPDHDAATPIPARSTTRP